MSTTKFPDWQGTTRRDGITVEPYDGNWVIRHPRITKGHVSTCQCCGHLLRTADAAKNVADRFWPMEPQQ